MIENILDWNNKEVLEWLKKENLSKIVIDLCREEELDGKCLLTLGERDFYSNPFSHIRLKDRKTFIFAVKKIQNENKRLMYQNGLTDLGYSYKCMNSDGEVRGVCKLQHSTSSEYDDKYCYDSDMNSDELSASQLRPEIWKTFVSLCYVFLVTWVTAVVMVIVHDKVPDMKKYPPLPDLFLDNVPHIPWAFDMCEITGSILMAIWVVVLLFHKHRFILLRRFFALAGTVFLLRCITMLITSLSVPGSHLKCAPRSYPTTDGSRDWARCLRQAYEIWSGAGMSVRGVRTCGDYMFSGHTVALTLLNFFITEYTSRRYYLLHIISWLMNMFGIFFILAAHEHYSIDVFIAFYITSRLFLYYHTLSNNQALMLGDSMRTRIWFPLLSYFECEVNGIVPNECESPLVLVCKMYQYLKLIFTGWYKCSAERIANTKMPNTPIGDISVLRIVGGIRRSLIDTGEFGINTLNRQLIDKDTQVCFNEVESSSHLPTKLREFNKKVK